MEAVPLTKVIPKSPLRGISVLLMGGTGSGKTYAIKTFKDKGITPFAIFLEPEDGVVQIPREEWHQRYIAPASASWPDMIQSAEYINKLSFKALTEMSDIKKSSYNQFVEFLRTLNNFKCDTDGKEYGDVCKWGTDRALIIDGLSGLSIMSMNLMVGSKPVKSQADWAVAMDNLERLIQKLCTDTRCHLVLISHVERETDEVFGGSKIMASTLGRKLAPKIPRFFSDVILAEQKGGQFQWSTAAPGADLKGRNVPVKEGLPPSFVPLLESWQKRGGIIEKGE